MTHSERGSGGSNSEPSFLSPLLLLKKNFVFVAADTEINLTPPLSCLATCIEPAIRSLLMTMNMERWHDRFTKGNMLLSRLRFISYNFFSFLSVQLLNPFPLVSRSMVKEIFPPFLLWADVFGLLSSSPRRVYRRQHEHDMMSSGHKWDDEEVLFREKT